MRHVSLYKVGRDLLKEKGRALIVIAAIFLGVFSVAMTASCYLMLNKNLRINYVNTNPASFIVVTERVDAALMADLKKFPGVEDAEVRNMVRSRFQTGPDTYIPLLLFKVDRFSDVRINKFVLKGGHFPENDSQIVIERTAGKMTDIQTGRRYPVKIPGNGVYGLEATGVVHDPGLAPSWMEGTLYGYVKRGFGEGSPSADDPQTLLTVSENKYDISHIREVATAIVGRLKSGGRTVYRTEVPKPGEHAHQSQMDSLMFLLLMFSLLTLFLSSFLIVNMVSAIMAREVRQIGVMKAIGAGTGKIASIYLSIVLILAVCATASATPLGIHAGDAYAQFVASMLNFTLFDRATDVHAIAGIVLTGILLPCLVSIFPIYRRSSITVREALNDYGVSEKTSSKGTAQPASFPHAAALPKTILLSLRNMFRRKTRLVLTLMVLTLGGAVFITTFNLRASTTRTIEDEFDNQKFDLAVVLDKAYPIEDIQKVVSKIDGIGRSEFWGSARTTVVTDDGLESALIDVRGVSVPSKMFFPEIIAGSWLSSGDASVVINRAFAAKHPEATIGRTIRLKLGEGTAEFMVKGVIREVFGLPTVYADYGHLASLTKTPGQTQLVMIGTSSGQARKIGAVSKAIERELESAHIDVRMMYEKAGYKERMVDHLLVITSMLIMMTCLIVLVGGLGIITTIGINVVERKREIGILRAIGTTNGLLYRIVMYEGLTFAIISSVCSVLLALPLSYYLGNLFFSIFFETTINFAVSPVGIVAWFVINIVFSAVAVLLPARTAAEMSVSTALAYE